MSTRRNSQRKQAVSRRQFHQWSMLAGAGIAATACGGRSAAPAPAESAPAEEAAAPAQQPSAPAAAPSQYKEAPMLAELVAAGQLPPVDERLPANPLVIEPTNEIGQYGGSIRSFMLNDTDYPAVGNVISNYGLISIPNDLDAFVAGLPLGGWIPYLAESYEWNDDATQITLRLREGMKWSDGEPFTSADVLFRWYDMLFDTDFQPSPPAQMLVDGQPVTLEAPDDYTLVFKFPAPYPAFPFTVLRGSGLTSYARHYLEQYHPKYNPSATYAQLQEISAPARMTPGLPTLAPWVIKINEPGVSVTAERNPYFCAVDSAGNQLPYADQYVFPQVGTQENAVLKAVAGEVDVVERNIQLFDQLPALRQGEEQGDYKLLFWRGTSFTQATLINFNYVLKDPEEVELYELLRTRDFRIALSVAIDRADINSALYFDLGRPTSYALGSLSPYWSDEMAAATMVNGEYDPARAESLLDGLGLEKGSDGIRTYPGSGKPVTLLLDVASEITMHQKTGEMVVRYWREVGIDARLNTISRSVLYNRIGDRTIQSWIWGTDANEIPLLRHDLEIMNPMFADPEIYTTDIPAHLGEVTPPEGQERMWEIQAQIFKAVDPQESIALHRELAAYRAEWMFNIHLLADLPVLIVRHNRMGNVPDQGLSLQNIIYEKPEQFYIKQA